MIESLKKARIMVVVAHPDDEVLGLGATMNRLISSFKSVCHVVILGEGITSRLENRDTSKWRKELKIHKKNILAAQEVIGYQSISIYDFPDNRFDSVALLDIIKVIEKEKLQFNPDAIFTHHGGDLNVDHQKTYEAVITATRPVKLEKVKHIITFETPSGTEWSALSNVNQFIPNFFVELDKNNIEQKIIAMESYYYEKRNYPHPRSPEALMIQAKKWGITVGKKYIEAFKVVRSVN